MDITPGDGQQDFQFPEDLTENTHTVLHPLYVVTQFFLGTILQQKTITYLTDELGEDVFSDLDGLLDTLVDNWETFVLYWLGFVILAAFGALFVIVCPITGICICCCRCCGKCGRIQKETKNSKCARITCGTFLFIFTFITFIGCLCAFLTSVHLWDQTKADDGALPNSRQKFEQLDSDINDTITDTDDLIMSSFTSAKNDIFQTLDNVGPNTRDTLGNMTNSGPLLDTLVEFTDNLTSIQSDLQIADNATKSLQSDGSQLQAELSTLQSDISDDVNLCSGISSECAAIADKISDLVMDVNYNDLEDLSLAILAIDYVIDDDIKGQVMSGWEEFENISDSINQTWVAEVNKAKDEINSADEEVQAFVDEVSDQLRAINLSTVFNGIDDVMLEVEEYGTIAFYVCCALTAIFLLIVILIWFGLFCGACCKRPQFPENQKCTTRIASTFLLAASGFMFIFTWLHMIITTALFLSGGLAYTEVCRHLVNPSGSPAFGVVNDIVSNLTNASIDVVEVLQNCKEDYAIYTALDVDSMGFNISETLDIDNYDIEELVDQIKSIDISLGNITILSDTAAETLEIVDIGIQTINFTKNYIIIDQNVTRLDLIELATDLENAAASLALGTLADQLLTYASNLRTLENTTVSEINTNRQSLEDSLKAIEMMAQSFSIEDLISGLTDAQNNLNVNGSSLIGEVINSTADSILGTVESMLSSIDSAIRHDLGRCLPVYQSVTGLVDIGCKDVLDPYNGYWLSHGWILICLIPMVFMCLYMAGLYRSPKSFASVGPEMDGQDNTLKGPAPEGAEMVQVTENLEDMKEPPSESDV